MAGDAALHADGIERGLGWTTVQTRPVTRFRLAVTGSILEAQRRPRHGPTALPAAARWRTRGRRRWPGGPAGSAIRVTGGAGSADGFARLDEAVPWLVHDADIHLSSPHGLEQYGGGAWGLRDVCQGPVELLSATGRHAAIADRAAVVYAHQERTTGDWPQWFMIDRLPRGAGA